MFADMILEAEGFAEQAELFELAPAKINLALHVVGRRDDGYHLLESIVTFADRGDRLAFSAAETDRFTLSGRFSPLLGDAEAADGNNLVLKARDRLRQLLRNKGQAAPPVAIHLEKNLPVAAGIGGGSADAAAALRGLVRLWGAEVSENELGELGLSLGADVPMCIRGEALMAKGIGEELTALSSLPSLSLVLGNPLIGVSTPDIFRRLSNRENPPIVEQGDNWLAYLKTLRNDLEPPARSLVREIDEISNLIGAEGASLVRMSGSGATCFGIFSSKAQAETAAANLSSRRPDWYFQAVQTVGAKI
ncbi:4-(cytidine 5'-diphospho)-2-C-methyl-D-erythritol kinase [Neorhizobium alkalisoli]|uniref:4-diphosphocytidyl-2-C-methyl-D-erythritol kinase n=1 Tax=Neorhizobium alkalisoli TaxID=528178 RepID=A0A561R3S5_9HYPH|nr:4-diphosphocytidyl-2-C-methyl-D-erythritol kinase [Neorhizobium alkalisoli]